MKHLIFRGYPRRTMTEEGNIGGFLVTVEHIPEDGRGTYGETPLDPRFDLVNHSPDGFAWGYGGSGPAQLALAILAKFCCPDCALRHYQAFKWEVIAKIPQDQEWQLSTADIIPILKKIHSPEES